MRIRSLLTCQEEKDKPMNLMIVTNSKYLPYTYVMLFSLFRKHPGTEIHVYLPYEDLTEAEIVTLTAFCASFPGKRLTPLYVGTAFREQVQSRNGINVETYYRILGLKLLPEEMERILYLDVDMVIKGDLTPLYRTDLTGKAFAVCEDIFGKINGFHEANKRRLSIPAQFSYFNAGVMLFNLALLREENAADRMLENIYRDYERYEYNDQDIMNEMYYDRLQWVGWDMYNCPPCHFYLDKTASAAGELVFADYDRMKAMGDDPAAFMAQYLNLTEQIYAQAAVIHYLADTKPWSRTRKEATVYGIFDRAYGDALAALKQIGTLPPDVLPEEAGGRA